MRSTLLKLLATLLILTMGLSFGSAAMAQDSDDDDNGDAGSNYYPIVVPTDRFTPGGGGGSACPEGAAAVTLSVQGATVVAAFPRPECVTNVSLAVGSAQIYNGPAPVTGILRLPIPVLDESQTTVTATVTTIDGKTGTADATFSPAAVAAANGVPVVPASVPAVAVPAAGGGGLAVTGVDSNAPLTIGLLLTGTGGLALLAARKRRQD